MTVTDQEQSETMRVAARLREQIIDGHRSPGNRLVEREIAAELGVSRVPAREALHELAAEGLVVLRPRTWAIVREFTERDVRELEEVRTSLDALAFTCAARRHNAQGLQRLEEVLIQGESAAAAGDSIGAHRAAAAFHSTVVELADNAHLQEIWRSLQSRVRWMLSQHDDLLVVAQDHRRLFEALASRDEDLLRRLVIEHSLTSREQYRERRSRGR